MADKILNTRTIKNSGGTILRHTVLYELDSAGTTKHWECAVEASEMTLDTDMAELKTLANAKATTEKTAWVAYLTTANTNTDDDTNNGDVTL